MAKELWVGGLVAMTPSRLCAERLQRGGRQFERPFLFRKKKRLSESQEEFNKRKIK